MKEKPRTAPRLVWLLASAATVALALAPSALARDASLVPIKAKQTGFGAFTEAFSPDPAPVRLANAFGTPDRAFRPSAYSCKLAWFAQGIKVELTNYGQGFPPCSGGYFLSARLTTPNWHTPNGIRPGSRARKARKRARRKCSKGRCGVSGYVLGQHFSECAAAKVPSVVAKVKKKRVTALIVLTHGCE